MNTYVEDCLIGLTKEKMQKVSKFRVDTNVQLAQAGKTALPVNEAVKYLHAARFDIPKAEDIFRAHQAYKQQYDLENLHTHRQQLNGEIRSKKLEIVGARDSDGAQLMVFTASRHNPSNSEMKTVIQLLFLLLDQISESVETQSKGVTMVVDLRETSLTSCDYEFIANIVSVLNGGYPVFLSNVYMIEATSWFKTNMKQYDSFRTLQREGKLKLVSLSELAKHIPKTSLPLSLGGTMAPGRAAMALAGTSTADTVAMYTRHTSPSHKAQKPRQPPVAPPPRNRVKPKSPPLGKGGGEGNSSPSDSQESLEDKQPVAGAVNKMKELFDQTTSSPSPHIRPTPPPRNKSAVSSHVAVKAPKPSPPPRTTAKSSQPVTNKSSSPEHKVKVPLLMQSQAIEKGAKRKPPVPVHATVSLDQEVSGSGNNQKVKALKDKFSQVTQDSVPRGEEKDKAKDLQSFHSMEDEKKTDGIPLLQKVFRRSNSASFKNQAVTESSHPEPMAKTDEKVEKVQENASRRPGKWFKRSVGIVRVPAKSKPEPSKEKITGTSQPPAPLADKPLSSLSDGAELSKPASVVSQPVSATSASSKLTITPVASKPIATTAHNSRHPSAINAVAQRGTNHKPSQASTVSIELPHKHSGGVSHEPSAPPTCKPPSYEKTVLKNVCPINDSGYETVEFTLLPTSSENKSTPVPSSSSAKPTLPYAVTTVAMPQALEPSRAEAKPRIKLPTAVASVTQVPTKTEASEGGRHAPQRTCYENVFINKLPGDQSDSEDEGVLLDDETNQLQDDVIYENFGPDEGNKYMNVLELEQYISKKGKNGLSAEYYRVKNSPLSGPSEVFRLPWNSNKNRYRDVVCYDKTRVSMTTIPGVKGSDYIHANYVDGYKKPKAFILTQGPMKRTVNDYWRMLWEQKVFVVVMTTKCVELGKLKCAQYWPDNSGTAHYGDISVSVIHSDDFDSYVWRKLQVMCNGECRILMHYQYVIWPDYGVPETGETILNLMYTVREMQGRFSDYVTDPYHFPISGPPIVIHCSAGIGRSGTFCALDYCIDELRENGRVNMQQAVRLLRQQRAFSIQTDEQYEFCYRTLLEYALTLKKAMGSR